MNSSIIHDKIFLLIHKKCHPKSRQSDIKYPKPTEDHITPWCNPFGSTRVVYELHRTRWSDCLVQCYRRCREGNRKRAWPNIPRYRRLERTYYLHSMGNLRRNGLWLQRIETPSSWLRTPSRSKWCCSTMDILLNYYLGLPLETCMCFLNPVDHHTKWLVLESFTSTCLASFVYRFAEDAATVIDLVNIINLKYLNSLCT